MTTLSSKIPGMNIWAYDMARRPDKSMSGGMPKLGAYTPVNTQEDVISPVTQKPTELVDQANNQVRYICDVNTVTKPVTISTHGIKWTTGTNPDQQIKLGADTSDARFTGVIFTDADVYIQAIDANPVTKHDTKTPFTTSTPGVTLMDQTGIVHSVAGFSVVVFSVGQGYKIPVGNIIKATPRIYSYGGAEITSKNPETYQVSTELLPGTYEMTLTEDPSHSWITCDIDFATVQTTPSTPPETPHATTIPIVQKLEHVTSNVTGASIDRKLNVISLTADAGYVFKDAVQVLFYSGGKVVSDYDVKGNNKDTITIPLNTTKENTITDAMDNMQLTATATLTTLAPGYEHNYLITDGELSAFGKDIIWTNVADVYDVSPYINNLIELPFAVNLPTTTNPISVGQQQSHVVSHETGSRFAVLDLGTIKVPAKYNNGFDYQNKLIQLYTPFVAPIVINNENAINKTIHISYKIDISNGNCTVNLDNDGVLFFTGISNISSQLPFLNTLKNTIINRDTHFNDNDIRQPYLIITRETPILNNDYYPTNERGLIKNYNGNVKVRVLNNMNIPNNELSELTNQLESGVKYVKGN